MLIIRLLAENSDENCKTCLFNAYSSHKELCELSVARKHASASHENCKMCLRYTRTFINVTATYSHEKCKICLFYACSSHIELRELSVAKYMLQPAMRTVRRDCFIKVATIQSYENCQSSQNTLQIATRSLRQGCVCMQQPLRDTINVNHPKTKSSLLKQS